jgi:hypothetical protein
LTPPQLSSVKQHLPRPPIDILFSRHCAHEADTRPLLFERHRQCFIHRFTEPVRIVRIDYDCFGELASCAGEMGKDQDTLSLAVTAMAVLWQQSTSSWLDKDVEVELTVKVKQKNDFRDRDTVIRKTAFSALFFPQPVRW